ncbi:MAG: hypothetical protein JXA96_07125 [Sedimentisphaerales bacterium]|nr:hypothetical protein [Sedimentisphaerales bacterium]
MAVTSKKRIRTKNDSKIAPEIQAAIDYGIDISALKANLKLSYTERAKRHQIALNNFKKLRKAKFL